MSKYVDGYVLSVPKKKVPAYKKMATKASKVWREHGALEYRECIADDMSCHELVPFPKLANSRPGEVVIFAYVVYKSRKHRDAVNKKVMADPRLNDMCPVDDMPFDHKRMAYGGFTTLVEA